MRTECSYDFGREGGANKRFKYSHQLEYTMRRISPAHNTTTATTSSMLSMFRRDCCLSSTCWEINWRSLWDILSSVTSSRGMASGDKLALSTHCRYSFLFFLLRKYFNNVASHRKHCPGFYSSYSNSNEHQESILRKYYISSLAY